MVGSLAHRRARQRALERVLTWTIGRWSHIETGLQLHQQREVQSRGAATDTNNLHRAPCFCGRSAGICASRAPRSPAGIWIARCVSSEVVTRVWRTDIRRSPPVPVQLPALQDITCEASFQNSVDPLFQQVVELLTVEQRPPGHKIHWCNPTFRISTFRKLTGRPRASPGRSWGGMHDGPAVPKTDGHVALPSRFR